MGETTILYVLCLAFAASVSGAIKNGKVNITIADPDLYACERVVFQNAFSGKGNVKAFVSFSHTSAGSRSGASVWVKTVTSRGFAVCILELGTGSNGTAQVNWLAFQDAPHGTQHGSVDFDKWTAGTQCKRVDFSQRFPKHPSVFGSVRDKVGNQKNALNVWVEDEAEDHFKVCMREVKSFDGAHENIAVDWFAYTDSFQDATYSSSLVFTNNGAPSSVNNYAFCRTVNYTDTLYAAPVVVITAKHRYDGSNANSLPPKCNAISAWIEYINIRSFAVCVVDYTGSGSSHDPITVDYVVIGDLDPCINVSCKYFAACRAYGPHDPRCVCHESCPSYEEPVCSSNGTSYDNKCLFEQETCQLQNNYTFYHPGSCEGFPMQKGRQNMAFVPFPEVHCHTVKFRPYSFYPDKPIQVQVTVNHFNTTSKYFVHDPAVSWTENINYDGFDVCVAQTGRGDRSSRGMAAIDWVAYQGAPEGGVAGVTRVQQWWTGTECETVNLPSGEFTIAPVVLVTAEHHHARLKRDAAIIWKEDVTKSSFKVCLRELQNFDGAHEDIYVSWLAFSEIHKPLFSEHGSVYFPNSSPPPAINNYAFCKDVGLWRTYNVTPLIIISANHTTGNGNLSPVHNGFTAWLENINTTGFRVCIKELYESRYDPLSVSYTVIPEICEPGWAFYNGYCYYIYSTCASWIAAEGRCLDSQAHLVSVHNQEENVYIQHRHAGEKAWIGFNDRSVEGTFRWASDDHTRFTFWAANQPNNYNNQDCVHTLGVGVGMKNRYRWNDVPCNDCHNYTCYKDYDECGMATDKCDRNAVCSNTVGSYTCRCKSGYSGDGFRCPDINACSDLSHKCDVNAVCSNTAGSHMCRCRSGFTGDGFRCTDINECSSSSHRCHGNAKCSNTIGSYTCQCRSGHTGNGFTCADVNECSDSSHSCDANADCSNTAGSYTCRCRAGFSGNGYSCTDIDECSSGRHSCHGNANCRNTVGSYTCSCQSGYTGNGHTCIVTECNSYKILSGYDRKITYGIGLKCDNHLRGWYRFTGAAGTRMPTSCVPIKRCNCYVPGWLNGGHPTVADGHVIRQVCFHWAGNCCYKSQNINVRNCGSFYVYYLDSTPWCQLRYCGTD